MYMLFKEKETKVSWLSALKSPPRAAPRGGGEEGAGDRDHRGLSTPHPCLLPKPLFPNFPTSSSAD